VRIVEPLRGTAFLRSRENSTRRKETPLISNTIHVKWALEKYLAIKLSKTVVRRELSWHCFF
jgi:hypothetical protein